MPDRLDSLRPAVLSIFQEARPDAILHAGDISVRRVLDQLQEIAPVYAVRGNRDWFDLRHLPNSLILNFEGVTIGLMHGHGNMGVYLRDKTTSIVLGTPPERYLRRALGSFPGARVVVFGHTHYPLNRWIDGRLYFNPGSAAYPAWRVKTPSLGIIKIGPDKKVESTILHI